MTAIVNSNRRATRSVGAETSAPRGEAAGRYLIARQNLFMLGLSPRISYICVRSPGGSFVIIKSRDIGHLKQYLI
jgi:hypothetical protein